jgi:hypothetical protein
MAPSRRESDYVLIPGCHRKGKSAVEEVGTADFADEVIAKLPAGSVYVRGGVVGEILGDAGQRFFRHATADCMRLMIDERLKLARWTLSPGGRSRRPMMMFVSCSRDNGGLVLSRARTHSVVPNIDVLTSYPVFLPGFKLCRPGYHEGVFYDEPEALCGLQPETDAGVIHKVLDELVVDFPFKDEASRQNFYGELLTPLVRIAIEGNAPLHLHNSPLERTGKTKLVEEGLGGVITGRRTPAQQLAASNEEMEKRVLAVLLKGQTMLLLDNVAGNIDSPVLASLLTATTFQGRMLGITQMVDVRNNLTIVVTGNNVKLSGEMAKRTVPILLQPASDRPEARTDYRHPNFWNHVSTNRRMFLSCLLGMVMTWAKAGAEPGSIPMGGFDSWAASVGGIMNHFGYEAWMTNAKAWCDTADTGRGDRVALVRGWHKAHGLRQVTAKEVYAVAERLQLYQAILNGGGSERARHTAFGMNVLARLEDCPVENWFIRRHTSSSPTKYWLEAIAGGNQQP